MAKMGRKKKPEYELPDEVPAVFECSPNLVPCKKFRHANIYEFVAHVESGKWKQCIAWFRQTDKELKTIRLLSAARANSPLS